MGVCSAKRLCFLFFNLLFLAIGGGLVGFIAWTLATIPNASQFISGTWIFQLTVFALGTVVAIIGLLGCFGGLCQNLCMLKVYIGLMVTLMFLEIGLAIAIYVEHSEISHIIESSWEGLNTDTRYELQKELKCCGIQNYTEYGSNLVDLPDSCFKPYDVTNIIDKTMENLYTANCLDSMISWIDNNVVIWVSSLLAIAVIQLISAIMSCVYMNRVQKKSKVKPNEAIEMQQVSSTTDKDQNGENTELDHTTSTKSNEGKEVDALSLTEGSVVMGDTDSLKEEVLLVGAVAMKKTTKDTSSLAEGSIAMDNLEPDGWESASLHESENKVEAIDSRSRSSSVSGSTKNAFVNAGPEPKEMLVAGALVAGVAIAESNDTEKDKISLAEGSVTMGDLEDGKGDMIVIPPSKTPNEGLEDKNQLSADELPGSVPKGDASSDDVDKKLVDKEQESVSVGVMVTEVSEKCDSRNSTETKTHDTNEDHVKHGESQQGASNTPAEETTLGNGSHQASVEATVSTSTRSITVPDADGHSPEDTTEKQALNS